VLLGSNEVATAREGVFAPVITVIRAEGEEDALHIANDAEYGLSSAVLTRDMDRGAQFARRVEAGRTHVNDSPVNEKASGIGRFGGRWAVDKFTTHRWLSVQREPRAGSRSEGLP
jgi:aldehyde dehydrogenase (NAD+)